MDYDCVCNTGLALGLGFSPMVESSTDDERLKKRCLNSDHSAKETTQCEPSLTLGRSRETYDKGSTKVDAYKVCINTFAELYCQDSGASWFTNGSIVKREREEKSEEVGRERVSSMISEEDDEGSNGRKKLRLTKAQSALLEETFKQHSTLNPKQKQELARELKLRPRQVEVWFQNRRARTKLKQTQVDCEYLKKWCETLTDENRRLEKELQELKAMKVGVGQPLYMQLPAAALTMCPSCERIGDDNSKSPIYNASKTTLLQFLH